ncbi:Root cap/late embryogenesis-like protein [Quillaja saponaria]|uniref:Root cap/late embryogenesis-like protein n=1 Tax=Quillaja saponaria TaxID=32244 RepID=A0AAD7KZK1_QUISA|nr:Root cap/late embryogenesis-like protein [Quillaja saponaria]
MEFTKTSSILVLLLVFVSVIFQAKAYYSATCVTRGSRCYGKKIDCPYECPDRYSDKPTCKAVCRRCYDPRFIGGDGRVFYFHGKSNEHFTLVSDSNLQINARFIGHRPAGRGRDYTWIQALGILSNSKTFSLEATKASKWEDDVDHLKFTYNGNDLELPEGSLSMWYSPEKDVRIERVASKNSIIVTLKDVAEILVNVVPVTKEDNRIHNYQVPSDDCFAHLEVQFRFFSLSPKVEGVLGRTYRPDFENPAKPGVAMPVLGGEDNYRTTSLLSAGCGACVFSSESAAEKETTAEAEYGTLDCTSRTSGGYGIVCKK